MDGKEERMASIIVKGMSCGHCKAAVTEAIAKIPGVSDVLVDLQSGKAEWKGDASPATVKAIKDAVTAVGFDVA